MGYRLVDRRCGKGLKREKLFLNGGQRQWIARLGVSRKWEAERLSVPRLLQLWSAFQQRQQTGSPGAELDNQTNSTDTKNLSGKGYDLENTMWALSIWIRSHFYIRELSLIIAFYRSSLLSLSGINIKQIWQLLYTSFNLSLCLSLSIFLRGLWFLLGVVLFTVSLFDS